MKAAVPVGLLAALVGCARPDLPVRSTAAEAPRAVPRVHVSLVESALRTTYEPAVMRPSDRTLALRILNEGTTDASASRRRWRPVDR